MDPSSSHIFFTKLLNSSNLGDFFTLFSQI